MSTQTLGWWLFGIQAAVLFYFCCVLPFRYVLRSGRFWRSVQFVWGTLAALTLCSALLGEYLRLHVEKSLADYCADGTHVGAFILLGWWPGIMVCTFALLIYRLRERFSQKQKSQSHETAA
jgi:hypothetical protein